MNKNYVKLLSLLLVAAVMATALLGCKAKEEPKATEPATQTEVTEAPAVAEPETVETEPEATEAVVAETEPEVDAPEAGSLTYEEYLALEVEMRESYYESFATADDFFAWLDSAKAEYEAVTEPTEVVGSEGESSEDIGIVDDTFEEESVEDW